MTLPGWEPLRFHPEHARGWQSTARFLVVSAGRRSGKTEVFAKRRGIVECLTDARHHNGRAAFCAPTQDQAKDIFFADLKRMIPEEFVRDVRESYPQTITLRTGYRVEVRGLDKPARIEGPPLDLCVISEVDDLKSIAVIDDHVLPALGTTGRPGKGIFEGVPNGKTVLWELRRRALVEPEWDYFEWPSEEVLLPEEIDFYRRNLDPESFDREFNASFANFEGRAYSSFDWTLHAAERLEYDPHLPLVLCFDFNVSPGVCVAVQEQVYRGRRPEVDARYTAVVGEVYIERGSTTEVVCRRILQDYGNHRGPVRAYGDATGGAAGTAKVRGSDWDLIGGGQGILSRHFGPRFSMRVPRTNPAVKVRVNAVNRRLLTADGKVRMLIDPARAPRMCEDLDGVTLIPGGAFEVDKRRCEAAGLTHLSDALGYYLEPEFPVGGDGPQAATVRPPS